MYKRIILFIITLTLILSMLTCRILAPSEDDGEDSGLQVPVTRLYLNQTLMGTQIGLDLNLSLEIEFFPKFTTQKNDIKWTTSCQDENGNSTIASISKDGKITVLIDQIPFGELFASTTFRVESTHDNSVFTEATLLIFPDLPRSRSLYFDTARWEGTTLNGPPEGTFPSINSAGDRNLGDGIFLLTGTGHAAGGVREGNDHEQGVYEIDPRNPYAAGIFPTGGVRTLAATAWQNSGTPPGSSPERFPAFLDGELVFAPAGITLDEFNDFTPPGFDPINPKHIRHRAISEHIRTQGTGMRVFQIAALHRPFRITVWYLANSAGQRWVDIRFGDTSGIRVEGIVSPADTANQGNSRVVNFIWCCDEDGKARSDFVPLTFIEGAVEGAAGIRFYGVEVEYLDNYNCPSCVNND